MSKVALESLAFNSRGYRFGLTMPLSAFGAANLG